MNHQEPEPASVDYEDQLAGDLQVGAFAAVTDTQHRKPAPVRHLHRGPLGFANAQEPPCSPP